MHPHEILQVSRSETEKLKNVTAPLLEWYDTCRRSMPWRDDPTPYHVWISEIMLQQTRVEAVRVYYDRFLEALPDILSLAEADEAVLMKLWEGLGYYSRVRNLQKAAKVVMQEHGGQLPASYEALLTLPGIGEYTAGAIASIAFGIPVPAVDGNVFRVLSRMIASFASVSLPKVKQAYRSLTADMQSPERPGDFTQALMELGAIVCLPNGAPLCGECPVAFLCSAKAQEIQLSLPVKAEKKARVVEQRTIILVLAANRLLLFRRPDRGLLSGLYEPLNLTGCLDEAQVKAALEKMGIPVRTLEFIGSAKHIFTHREWHMTGYLACTNALEAPEGGIFADREQLRTEFAVPNAFHAFLKTLVNYNE